MADATDSVSVSRADSPAGGEALCHNTNRQEPASVKVRNDSLLLQKVKAWIRLTPSIHPARFAIAVGAAGADVTIGEAAHKESMASTATEELWRKCMMSFSVLQEKARRGRKIDCCLISENLTV
jgi:hypothetical protein